MIPLLEKDLKMVPTASSFLVLMTFLYHTPQVLLSLSSSEPLHLLLLLLCTGSDYHLYLCCNIFCACHSCLVDCFVIHLCSVQGWQSLLPSPRGGRERRRRVGWSSRRRAITEPPHDCGGKEAPKDAEELAEKVKLGVRWQCNSCLGVVFLRTTQTDEMKGDTERQGWRTGTTGPRETSNGGGWRKLRKVEAGDGNG